MLEFVGVIRSFLVIVLLWAAVAKLWNLPAVAEAIRRFGLSSRPSRARALGLVGVELGLAAAMLVVSESWVPAAATAAFFGSATALITRALMRQERFACACFGRVDAPLSRATAWRATSLAGAAAVVSLNAAFSNSRVPDLETSLQIVLATAAAISVARLLHAVAQVPAKLRQPVRS